MRVTNLANNHIRNFDPNQELSAHILGNLMTILNLFPSAIL
jgi:hypothetical protein